MKRLGFVVAVTTVFSVACTKDQPVQPPTTGGPAFLISDGTHSGGNPNFFFLQPLVPDPSGSPNFVVGTFKVGTPAGVDRKSTRLNSSHGYISYAVFCLKKKNNT